MLLDREFQAPQLCYIHISRFPLLGVVKIFLCYHTKRWLQKKLSKDTCRSMMKSVPSKKVISFMSNTHAERLKVNSSRISPIVFVCAMARSVEIVNNCRIYTNGCLLMITNLVYPSIC